MCGLANGLLEGLGNTGIEEVSPRRAAAVSLGILAFVLAQIRVVLHEGLEGVSVGVANPEEFVDIVRNVHEVGGDTVAVHVVGIEVAVGTSRITSIEQVDSDTITVEEGREHVADRSGDLVGNDINTALQTDEGRTVDAVKARVGR